VTADGVVEGLDVLEDLRGQRAATRPGATVDELLLERGEEASATALSKQSPLLPIERAIPASPAA
jgi:hypothetical protein